MASSAALVSKVFSAHTRNSNGGGTTGLSRNFVGPSQPYLLALRPPPPRSFVLAFARRRKNSSQATARTGSSSKSKRALQKDNVEDDDIGEDAIKALFALLEEDLKNDLSDGGTDEEITEEDLARLEQELEEALGDGDYGEVTGGLPLDSESMDDGNEDEEERPPKLKNWQIKRLARALKIGRRKTSIKTLAAELGLERPFVLDLLRDPPPYLLMMCASLLDEVIEIPSKSETEPPMGSPLITTVDVEESTNVDIEESKPEADVPVHVMRTRWSMQKRLKKAQVETLERVYSRTRRPTNAMIGSIVHVTNLPWKRVVKWFEDKRTEDGIPDHRVPYRRPVPDNISTS